MNILPRQGGGRDTRFVLFRKRRVSGPTARALPREERASSPDWKGSQRQANRLNREERGLL